MGVMIKEQAVCIHCGKQYDGELPFFALVSRGFIRSSPTCKCGDFLECRECQEDGLNQGCCPKCGCTGFYT